MKENKEDAMVFEESTAVHGAKRLAVNWCPWMGDWFVSNSPRNENSNAEGFWYEWAHMAAQILSHPLTKRVAPELYRNDLAYRDDIYTERGPQPALSNADIAACLEEAREELRRRAIDRKDSSDARP